MNEAKDKETMVTANDENRTMAVELAKRQLIDVMWKTASIEVDGITFPDTQEILEGRAPAGMAVNDIIVVNNIKHAWMFLLENIDRPVDWQYVSEYNRILGAGLIRDAGKLRTNDVRVGGTDWIPDLPTMESSHDEIGSLMEIEPPENRAHDDEPCAHQRRHRRVLHKPVPETRFHGQAAGRHHVHGITTTRTQTE